MLLLVEIKTNKLVNKQENTLKKLAIDFFKKAFVILEKKNQIDSIDDFHLERKQSIKDTPSKAIFVADSASHFQQVHSYIRSFLFHIRNDIDFAIDILFHLHEYIGTMKAKYINLINTFVEFFYVDLSSSEHFHADLINFATKFIEVILMRNFC